jgi:glycosyltransferase involved in cell wall biosynthesis
MSKPFFSIITCTFNSGKFIKKNIQSVSSQSFNNYEHIFIDGNSTDNTLNLINACSKSKPESTKLFKYPPKGISDALNKGIEHANGKYLIHLNSDDSFFDKNVLHDVYIFLKKKKWPDWIYGKANTIEVDGTSVGIFPNRWFFKLSWGYLMKFIPFIPHQAVFIKKTVFNKFGLFDETLKTKMDPDLWMRIKNKTRWIFYDRIICNYMIRPGSASSSNKAKEEGIADFEKVQLRNMNKVEFFFARTINKIVNFLNKTRR